MKLTADQRVELRMKFGGFCAYCGIELPEKGWHADHVLPIYREAKIVRVDGESKFVQTGKCERPENESLDNYFPACAACNLFKSVYSLEIWRRELSLQVERARRQSFNFRFAERFGLIQETGQPVVFFFERLRANSLIEAGHD